MTGADIMIIYNWEMIKRNCINQKNHNLKLTHCCQMKLILIPNLLELTFWLELTFSFQLPCCSTNLNFTVFQEIEKKKSWDFFFNIYITSNFPSEELLLTSRYLKDPQKNLLWCIDKQTRHPQISLLKGRHQGTNTD